MNMIDYPPTFALARYKPESQLMYCDIMHQKPNEALRSAGRSPFCFMVYGSTGAQPHEVQCGLPRLRPDIAFVIRSSSTQGL